MLPEPANSSYSSSQSKLVRKMSTTRTWKYLRRILMYRHMDFEFALWQMLYLCVAPQKVYRNFHYHKQTKDQWARDDPAFLVLLSFWLCVSSIGFAVVLKLHFLGFIKFLLWVVFVDCIGFGLTVATLLWENRIWSGKMALCQGKWDLVRENGLYRENGIWSGKMGFIIRDPWHLVMENGILVSEKNGIWSGKIGLYVRENGIWSWKMGLCQGKNGIWSGKMGFMSGKMGFGQGKWDLCQRKWDMVLGKMYFMSGKMGFGHGKWALCQGKWDIWSGKMGFGQGKWDLVMENGLYVRENGIWSGKMGFMSGKMGFMSGKMGFMSGKMGFMSGKMGFGQGKWALCQGKWDLVRENGLYVRENGIWSGKMGFMSGKMGFGQGKWDLDRENGIWTGKMGFGQGKWALCQGKWDLARMYPSKKITLIFDMQETGLANMDMDFVKFIVTCFTNYFPNTLGKFISKPDLTEYVDEDKLLERLGGKVKFDEENLAYNASANNSALDNQGNVKTTSPESYRVRPSAGVISPNSFTDVSVYLQPGHTSNVFRDKFLVMSTEISEGMTPAEIAIVWKSSAKSSILEHRLRCSIVSTISPSSESQHSETDANTSVIKTSELTEQLKSMERKIDRVEKKICYIEEGLQLFIKVQLGLFSGMIVLFAVGFYYATFLIQ
ncbi:hypothetical protein QZH41_003652 [Actinostola sp. cb2023]|nr:hypothetical protein QZH41_003652 [Actinostola sp. cb2023]